MRAGDGFNLGDQASGQMRKEVIGPEGSSQGEQIQSGGGLETPHRL